MDSPTEKRYLGWIEYTLIEGPSLFPTQRQTFHLLNPPLPDLYIHKRGHTSSQTICFISL